jgi:hypothetical protein
MKTEDSVRVVTLGKIQRDGQQLKQFARFVIVLRNGIPQLIDNGNRRRDGLPFARLITVLGPAHHEGVLVSEAVLLEIGYSRTRPYTQLEQVVATRKGARLAKTWFLKGRVRVRKISDQELKLVYSLIEQCMAQVVLECREDWKPESREKRYLKKGGAGWVDRGIYFTVSKSDQLLYRQVLAEDIRYRREKYINWHATCIRLWIGKYSLRNSDKQLRQRMKVSQAAELISSKNYRNPLYRRALVESFPVNSRVRLLLERMDSIFNLRLGQESDEICLLEQTQADALQPFLSIRCRVVNQPKVHANGSVVAEVTLERKFREDNECPF